MALASLPPDAQREPSGDMVTVVKYQTFTYLSHPAETMMGFALLGENLTQDTQSW